MHLGEPTRLLIELGLQIVHQFDRNPTSLPEQGTGGDGKTWNSNSEWASPLVIVTKKDGDLTKFDAYAMPRFKELLDNIGSAEFVTTLDLAKGYWQVPLEPEDRDKTAFTSPRGLYQFTTMPFGLTGAPATFQRLMDDVLRVIYRSVPGRYCHSQQ